MSLTVRELHDVVRELKQLEGGFVQKVYVTEPRVVVLDLRQPGRSTEVFVCAEPSRTRLHAVAQRPPSPESPLGFQGLLRTELTGLMLHELRAEPNERLVWMTFTGKDRLRILAAELSGRHGNLFLLDEQKVILGLAAPNLSERRDNRIGQPYTPPLTRELTQREKETRFPGGEGDFPLSRAISEAYSVKERRDAVAERRTALLASSKAKRDKLARTIERVKGDIQKASRADEYRRHGELLKANLFKVKRGMKEVRLTDYSETGVAEVSLPLDPARSPQENLERFFHQYRRLSAGRQRAQARLEELERELKAIEEKRAAVASLSDDELLRLPLPAGQALPGRKKRQQRAPPFRELVSPSGQRIRVGRNAEGNDVLTFKHSKGNDLWLHARGIAGSHVVVPLERDEPVKDETLKDAALLAAHHSEWKGRERCEVAYTRAKYVRRQKGGPAGAVTYSQEKSLMVAPDPARLAKLNQSLEEEA